ncbi:MAG: hypothetical protein IJD28_01620 [Deferribacterales bacterium]|nr:hypothetical protein [Deferribacterales bacterium]
MLKAVIFIILFPIVVNAANPDYDSNFEAGGSGGSYAENFENGSVPTPIDITKFYESHTDGIVIPQGILDKPNTESIDAKKLGESVSGKVTSSNSFESNIVLPLQSSNIKMQTLSETYHCPNDTDTQLFSTKAECESKCSVACEQYLFDAQISCQKSVEIIKVSAVNPLSSNTPLRIEYNGKSYITQPVTAICSNGYLSNKTAYEWLLTNSSLDFLMPSSMKTLGECRDISGKAFLSVFTNLLNAVGTSFHAHLSSLGYVAGYTLNNDMTLSVNVIKAGACDGNNLQTALPNENLLKNMSQGNLSDSQARQIAESDEIYKLITSSKQYEERSCTIKTNVSFSQTDSIITGNEKGLLCSEDAINVRLVRLSANEYALDLIDYHEWLHQSCDWAVNADPPLTDDGWHRMRIFKDGHSVSDMNITLKGYHPLCSGSYSVNLNDTVTSGGSLIDCPGQWPASARQQIEITYSYSYKTISDSLSVSTSDNCASIPSDCRLVSESVCDMNGLKCVKTRDNGVSTGAVPKKLCNDISTASDKYSVCSDGNTITAIGGNNSFSAQGGYFLIKRDYSCNATQETYDYTSFLEQDSTISSSTVVKGDVVSFKGIDMDGNLSDFSASMGLFAPECNKSCKVKAQKTEVNQIVLHDGTVSDKPSFHTAYYKTCNKDDNGNWSCPIDSGEVMLSDCSCADDFADTVLQLQIISESSTNMKCSSK